MLEAAIPFPKVSLLRRAFLGGSDARIIMGSDEAALLRLWREKRGEAEPTDYSGNLLVQLGLATEPLKSALVRARDWARHQRRPDLGSASRDPLDGGDPGRHRRGQWGRVRSEIHAPLVILRRGGRREAYAAGQHNMWVTNATAAVLSIITGGGKWVEIKISADPLYQHLLLTAEKKFWRCVESGEPPRLFGAESPRARIEAVRIVDMSSSNAWAEFSNVFRRTREAYLEHENAKAELKGLMPEDAKEAIGHGVRAKRSRSGAVSFDVLSMEASRA